MQKPPHFIAYKLDIDISTVKTTIAHFRKCYRMNLAERRSLRGKRSVYTEEHVEFIKQLTDKLRGTHYTASVIQQEFKVQFPNMPAISLSTIYRILKSKLNMSFRKLSKFNKSLEKQVNVRIMNESMLLQLMLEQQDLQLLYLDEFSIQTRNSNCYGWAAKGNKAYIYQFPSNFSLSVTICFSQDRMLGVTGNSKTNNSQSFVEFLKEVFDHNSSLECIKNNRFILVMDNAPIHTSKETKAYLK
jgi:hypothetical protein